MKSARALGTHSEHSLWADTRCMHSGHAVEALRWHTQSGHALRARCQGTLCDAPANHSADLYECECGQRRFQL